MLKKKFRLTKKDSFKTLLKEGLRKNSKMFLVKYLPNQLDYNRFSVVISKKVEKGAVKRNKVRRKFYEALRNNHKNLNIKSSDIIMLVNKNALNAKYSEIEKEIFTFKL